MWTDEQWELLKNYVKTNDIKYLEQLVLMFKDSGKQFEQRATSLEQMIQAVKLQRGL